VPLIPVFPYSRIPVFPYSVFRIPYSNSKFPIPNSQFPIPNSHPTANILSSYSKPKPSSNRTMLVMSGAGQRFYEDDEAEQILNLAASMSSSDGRMSHERLLETAAELGISQEAVEIAEKQITTKRLDNQLRAEFDTIQRREFYPHLAFFLIFNAVFVVMSLRQHYFWALWPLIWWGIGLANHASVTMFRGTSGYQKKFEKWRAERQGQPRGVSTLTHFEDHSPRLVLGVHACSGHHARLRRQRAEKLERRERL